MGVFATLCHGDSYLMMAFLAVRDALVRAYLFVPASPTAQIFLPPTMMELRFYELYRGLVGVVMISL